MAPKKSPAGKLVIANWKMNPSSLLEATRLSGEIASEATSTRSISVILAVPSVFIRPLQENLSKSNVTIGAQSVHHEKSGTHTGGVSASMLASLGIEYVIVGHSERRESGVTDEKVNQKVKLLLKHTLQPIVCVGSANVIHTGTTCRL